MSKSISPVTHACIFLDNYALNNDSDSCLVIVSLYIIISTFKFIMCFNYQWIFKIAT